MPPWTNSIWLDLTAIRRRAGSLFQGHSDPQGGYGPPTGQVVPPLVVHTILPWIDGAMGEVA